MKGRAGYCQSLNFMKTLLFAAAVGTGVFMVAGAAPATPVEPAPAMRVVELRCEHRTDPSGLGEANPRLSWELVATDPGARNLKQGAYQILVADSPEALERDQGDLWDSGRIASDSTAEIAYAGRALASREGCWWKVRIWDASGHASGWSEPARWTMALLEPSAWRAEWIGLDAAPPAGALTDVQRARVGALAWMQADVPPSRTLPTSVLIRRGFTLPADRTLTRATFIVTPDQWCSVTLNGRGIGEAARWEPTFPFDLTAAVARGDNVLGLRITQADGYTPAVAGELELTFADGGFVRLEIDATWRFSKVAADGWDTPGFSGPPWAPLQGLGGRATPWGSPNNSFRFLPPPPILSKTFQVAQPVRRATLYATALGLYEARVNGARVGRDYFTPGWTDYAHRVQYQAYDVTGLVKPGPNDLQALLGDGWYAGLAAYTGKRQVYGGYPRFAAQLELELANGSRQIVVTDASWRGAFGPVRSADILMGCSTDFRRAPADWQPVAIGLRAVPGVPVDAIAKFALEPATVDPVQVSEERPAASVMEPAPGVYVIDFGQNLVGWVRLKLRGIAGQKVVVRHGEMLNPNGTVYTSNLRGAAATDEYWLTGQGGEILEPHFTFHGFRYAQVTGLGVAPAPADAVAIVAGSALRRTGDFSCSNPLLNQLYRNIIWGQRGNYFEAPTDCPQRDERLGWTGDTQFFIPTAAYNFDVASFIERWLVTITDDQGPDGTFPDVAPATTHNPKAITAWGDAAIVCTHELWRAYGDTRVVQRRFDALARYIGWLEVSAQKDVLAVGGYEDWLNQGGGADPLVIDTAYGAYLCGLMADMARAIGRAPEAQRFAALRQKFADGFRDHFLLADGRIWNSSQTGFALAFDLNLLPGALREKAAAQFVADVAAHNGHLATGFIGTPRLLPALDAAGRDDVAYEVLLQDTYPSWLFQVKNGATTMWERWDGWTPDKGFETIDMNSFNHYAFGAVAQFLYRQVLGIDTDGPGYRRIRISPRADGRLTEAHGSYEAVTGRIAVAWRIADGNFILEATLPPNTTGTVQMPSGQTYETGSGAYRYQEPFKPAN